MSVDGLPLEFDGKIVTRTASETAAVRLDMPETVLDGRLGEICQKRMRQFPRAYSWGALVTAAGSLIPRREAPIRTNLFWCPVGPTASGKSQSMETSFRVLGLGQTPVLLKAKYGSAEALIEKLERVGPEGVRLVAVDELAHLMVKAAIERASFPYILNTAYYEDRLAGGSKGHQFNLNCRLSLAGGVVEELFGEVFGAVTTGGLYDRFIFGLCPMPYSLLWRPPEGEAEVLNPFPARVSADVWEARDEWVTRGISQRVAEHALRVAYICCSVDGRPELRGAELAPALSFAQYQMRVRRVLAPNAGENPDARCAIGIRNWLSHHAPDGQWVSRRSLDRGINACRLGPGVFNRCLNNLVFNGEIQLRNSGREVRLQELVEVEGHRRGLLTLPRPASTSK